MFSDYLRYFPVILDGLVWPLLRLLIFMSVALLVATLLEALHWTRLMARLSSPLARLGRLNQDSAASFALAFFSPAASNALLAEAHARGRLSAKELVLANLLNSSPTFLVHLPTLLSVVLSFLGEAGLVYVTLSFAAASLRSGLTLLFGRFLLPAGEKQGGSASPPPWRKGQPRHQEQLAAILQKAVVRFKKRLLKMLKFTLPIYCLFFVLHQAGAFEVVESFMAGHLDWLPFLKPEAVSVVVLYLAAEGGAALSAAAPLLHGAALAQQEVILALLVGNILSSPMRAFRHQFPSYAGYYPPRLAFALVCSSQALRAASLAFVAFIYYLAYF